MDLYKIICPYCQHVRLPTGYEKEGYEAVICDECGQPYVNQTTWTTVYHSLALVAFDLECKNPVKETATESTLKYMPWLPTPYNKNCSYRISGDYVEVKYRNGRHITTTLADVYMLCEEKNTTAIIKEMLRGSGNTRNVAAVNAFVKAVRNGQVAI